MNRLISVPKLRAVFVDRGGATSVEFAVVLTGLMVVSLGIVDFTLLMFDYARSAEATRRGARVAAISPPVGNLDTLASAPVKCTHNGTSVGCDGTAVANGATFDNIVTEMKAVYGDIAPYNVEITYTASGIGEAETGGYKPHVEVRLIDFQRAFYGLQAVAGVASSITMPSFPTAVLGSSYEPSGS